MKPLCLEEFHQYRCVLGKDHKEEKHRSSEGYTWYICQFCGRNHSAEAHRVLAKRWPTQVKPTPAFLEKQKAEPKPLPEPTVQGCFEWTNGRTNDDSGSA